MNGLLAGYTLLAILVVAAAVAAVDVAHRTKPRTRLSWLLVVVLVAQLGVTFAGSHQAAESQALRSRAETVLQIVCDQWAAGDRPEACR